MGLENGAGTGPYVGWYSPVLAAPSVLFNFAAPSDIDSVSIHADDSGGAGGVALPSRVSLTSNNVTAFFDVPDDPNSTTPTWFTLSDLGYRGIGSLRVGFEYGDGSWIFVDEVRFAGPIPEPGTWALMALGLAAVAVSARARRRC